MPRDLFGDVNDPSVRVGNRSGYTVAVSGAAHLVVIGTLVIVPLMASGVLPDVKSSMGIIVLTAPPPPEPPPPLRATPPAPAPAVAPDAAPVDVPQSIEPETGMEPGFERNVTLVDGGVAGSITGDPSTVLAPPPPPPPPAPKDPVRIGGDILPPTKMRDVAPIYPPIAQSARVQGMVILEATIGVDGRVTNVRVLRSIPLLDRAAVEAVQQWEYSPTRLNGVPVPVVMSVTVRFDLR